MIEITRHEDQHLRQPVGNGALSSHIEASRHGCRCASSIGKFMGECDDALRRKPNNLGHTLGRVLADKSQQFVDAGRVIPDDGLVHTPAVRDLTKQSGE